MKIIEQRLLRGPNLYAHKPCLLTVLDLEDLYDVSSLDVPGFTDRLIELMPSLQQHRCSVGQAGGFILRLRDGTYMAHIIEHVALELQCLAGAPAGFGRTRQVRGKPGQFRVVCSYQLEQVAVQAFEIAMALVGALARSEMPDLAAPLASLRQAASRHAIGTSTGAVIDAARRRGIPSFRITEQANLFQLGWGCRQKRLQATITGETSYVAVKIASDKQLTKALLKDAGVPVPQGSSVHTVEEALLVARRMRVPVTIKPLDANQGKGVTTVCATPQEVQQAYERARRFSRHVIVERFIEGQDYRVLVTGNNVAAASRRRPPFVIGDGVSTIAQLVEVENCNPARGEGHTNILTKIALDEHAATVLEKQGHGFDSVLPEGASASLRGNANLSTGGTAEDVTDLLPEETRDICVRAARTIGLDIAGIDIVCRDIALPLREQGGGIIEVNAAPGIRMHQYPASGQSRDAGDAIVEALYGSDDGRIPVIAVTGTNGKTTTALLIAHTTRHAGLKTGVTTTEGVFIDGKRIVKGDCSGYWSARTVLTSPEVEFAVLETARGGILKRGLAFDRCHVGIVLNVTPDHLGLDGIDRVEDLARVKAVVAHSASDAVVLNAEDAHCVAMADDLKEGVEVLYFSLDAEHPVLLRHVEQGGRAAYLQDGAVVLADGKRRHQLLAVDSMPMTLGGHARFNIANALAAAAALMASSFDNTSIAAGLSSFVSDGRNNPLRSNLFDIHGVTVVVDYAHNPAAYAALAGMARSMSAGRLVGVITAPGDRRAEDLRAVGQTCAAGFDELVLYESDARGRPDGETTSLILEGARGGAIDDALLHIEPHVHDALRLALSHCHPGDALVFACGSSLNQLIDAIRDSDPDSARRIAAEVA